MTREGVLQLAEKLIVEARLSRATHLSLSGSSLDKLTKIPETIKELSNLNSLDISDNLLTEIPEWIGQLTKLQDLNLSNNRLNALPEALGNLRQLKKLHLSANKLIVIPSWIGNLLELEFLNISDNKIDSLPDALRKLKKITSLNLGSVYRGGNSIKEIPSWINELTSLRFLDASNCQLKSLPNQLCEIDSLTSINLYNNPLNPELSAAYQQGFNALKVYLLAKTTAQITLNEAKLILVGEGEVGKSCLLSALRDDAWEDNRPTTHGIEIKPIKLTDLESKTEITLNGWDFGGQRVYRPTHQLFFSSPAVYLVVWKPREGPQQGFVKEWIQLVKRREPTAKILVVATHGGPQQRQPDIDRQELWDLFGKETVIDFFFVESKPDQNGERRGIEELKQTIARIAVSLPEVGSSVPKSFQEARQFLQNTGAAYLPLERVLTICREHKMNDDLARLFVTISHKLGHLIYYEHDPALRDIVVLKPDWLATAISFVLDDETTRSAHGLVRLSRLSMLWNDSTRETDSRYPATLHPIFLRLMERFDLSYRVAGLSPNGDSNPQSLIAQLVPDNRPENDLEREWSPSLNAGDIQQVQICRIVDAQNGQSASAEGLFYQLIVRLHKYSLGRENYNNSVHWQRGLVLDDGYNGRALLEHVGNNVRITVRAAYPERFLAMLTSEVKYLVESFWEGLRCDVMVPCITPCGKDAPGTGLFDVQKLIESKRKNRPEFPCPVCNEWQSVDHLLRNAPDIRPQPVEILLNEYTSIQRELVGVRELLVNYGDKALIRFDRLDSRTRRILSKVDDVYAGIMSTLTDEAKEGPRLFSLVPADRSAFNPKQWVSAKFRLILWCEHSRWPLPILNGKNSQKGVYELELTREWFKKAAPFLKVMTSTLSLILPVAASGVKLAMEESTYKSLENYLGFGKDVIDASLSSSEKIGEWMGAGDSVDLTHGAAIRADGATLRELHALLKAKDPGFGGLVRVMNKRQEFLWVHEQFKGEY